jgi:hypothetical protein
VFLAASACAAQPIDDIEIACTSDTECPSETWCDLRRNENECRSLDHSGPPHIVYDGFLVGTAVMSTISVPAKTTTIHTMLLRNDGRSQTYVTVEVVGPACLGAGSLVRSDGELVDEGKPLEADFAVRPAMGCPSPASLTVTATASGRMFTFTAMISITP